MPKRYINNPHSPFHPTYGQKIKSGQDSMVYSFADNDDWVVKYNHEKRVIAENRSPKKGIPPIYKAAPESERKQHLEDTESQLRYRQKKYQILQLFLGEFVPESHFVLGQANIPGGAEHAKGFTIQRRVPDVLLKDLTPKQRQDPRLESQMFVLLWKLQNMYKVLGEVNARMGDRGHPLDGKLDLSGISDFAREHIPTGINESDAAYAVDHFQDSPNLLVDPQTMQLYAVDFDDGMWGPEKEEAKQLMEEIVAERPFVQDIINLQPEDFYPNGVAA